MMLDNSPRANPNPWGVLRVLQPGNHSKVVIDALTTRVCPIRTPKKITTNECLWAMLCLLTWVPFLACTAGFFATTMLHVQAIENTQNTPPRDGV